MPPSVAFSFTFGPLYLACSLQARKSLLEALWSMFQLIFSRHAATGTVEIRSD